MDIGHTSQASSSTNATTTLIPNSSDVKRPDKVYP